MGDIGLIFAFSGLIHYISQNNLLQAYFNHSTATPQKFLTNTRNKLLTPDRLEYLHFWLHILDSSKAAGNLT